MYEKKKNLNLSEEEKQNLKEKIVDEMDQDKSGAIDLLELKVFITRKYDEMFRLNDE